MLLSAQPMMLQCLRFLTMWCLGVAKMHLLLPQLIIVLESLKLNFYDKILQEEIGGVKGHFGPINALAFNLDGKSFSSGGEDNYVRLHHFDSDYFKIPSLTLIKTYVTERPVNVVAMSSLLNHERYTNISITA